MSVFRGSAIAAVLAVAVTAVAFSGPFTTAASAQEDASCSLSHLVVPLAPTIAADMPIGQTTPEGDLIPDVSFGGETCIYLQELFLALAGTGAIAPAGLTANDFADGCDLQSLIANLGVVAPAFGVAGSGIPSVGMSEGACISLWQMLMGVASGEVVPQSAPIDLESDAETPSEPEATDDADDEATEDSEGMDEEGSGDAEDVTEESEDAIDESEDAVDGTEVTEDTEATEDTALTAESSIAVEEEADPMAAESSDGEPEILVEELESTTVE